LAASSGALAYFGEGYSGADSSGKPDPDPALFLMMIPWLLLYWFELLLPL